MKHIKRFNESKKEETQEVKFDAKELVDKDAESGFTTDTEDQEKVDKKFKKEMDKVDVDNIKDTDGVMSLSEFIASQP